VTADPLVSFVVLCYNHQRFVGECLESILGQEGGYNFEVILVDDASTDGSQEVARSYSDPRIEVICHEQNLGHIATVHEGLARARGRYIARIDSDDRYRSYYLKDTIQVFERHAEVGLVYGNVGLIDGDGNSNGDSIDDVHGALSFKGNELLRLLERNFISAPTVIARRNAWLSTLPVPQGLAFHDWYFTLMIARKHAFYYVSRVLADYRVHAGNLHTAIIKDRSEEPSIFWLLDRLFSEREADPELEQRKQRARNRIYGAHYLLLANKYFGFGMSADARRCYAAALRHRPEYALRFDVMRRLVGSLIGRNAYDMSKSTVNALMAAFSKGQ
jgi:glycosyltransferase involved in cell wall biosynthesis